MTHVSTPTVSGSKCKNSHEPELLSLHTPQHRHHPGNTSTHTHRCLSWIWMIKVCNILICKPGLVLTCNVFILLIWEFFLELGINTGNFVWLQDLNNMSTPWGLSSIAVINCSTGNSASPVYKCKSSVCDSVGMVWSLSEIKICFIVRVFRRVFLKVLTHFLTVFCNYSAKCF